MVNYYLKSTYGDKPNAGSKARNDVDIILENQNFTPIHMKTNDGSSMSRLSKILFHKEYIKNVIKVSKSLKKNDVLFYQHPIQGAFEFNFLMKLLKQKKVKVVAIVHDLEIFRQWDANYNTKRAELNDKKILSKCDYIVLHNRSMIERFISEVKVPKEKIVDLKIFDYLNKNKIFKNKSPENKIIIAGNLRKDKSGYLYDLNLIDYQFSLYGNGYEESSTHLNIEYKGAVSPDEIVNVLDGEYGLVWDGESIETCSGSTGKYLQVNNPHKTSLYLAAGIPVIIWSEAALASFITENNLGIVVDNLNEIPSEINLITKVDYSEMKQNCITISQKISEGYFMKTAINEVLSKINRSE